MTLSFLRPPPLPPPDLLPLFPSLERLEKKRLTFADLFDTRCSMVGSLVIL